MSRRRLAWILLALGLIVAALAVLRQVRPAAGAGSEDEPIVAVTVTRPRRGTIESTASYSGNLLARNTVTVPAESAGKVERILVKEGDRVGAEDFLVQMEDRAARLQMEQAHAAWRAAAAQEEKARQGLRREEIENARALHRQAEGDLKTAEESFRRAERLYQGGALARADYEQAESGLRAARTALENAGRTLQMVEEGGREEERRASRAQAEALYAQYELARLRHDDTRLAAPAAGIVTRVLIDAGNSVGPGTPLLVIAQDDPIVARINVPEKHYGRILRRMSPAQGAAGGGAAAASPRGGGADAAAGVPARVRAEAYLDSPPFTGGVSSLSPTVDPQSRTFWVEVEVPNPRGLLRPGMYVTAELVLERREGALLVPAAAVLQREGEDLLFVADAPAASGAEAVARRRTVRLGASGPREVQVVEGLQDGERVIDQGNAFLEEGQRVRIVEQR